ncbi:hypothetical protein Lalb_Chr04g0247911 [Lupinus albus]|uniref:DUF4408 domain-containing protein n=1 Tax=Lupinus albus TaxID=3870 RepID=A0A6A4QMM9_LUPAL|nr:hypothetical protein Lalb_Chr04g0247911 [Lupinus albus]
MDQLRYQNIASLTHSIKAHHNLVMLTQFLVSVSLCSFIFSPSSLFIFLHYFKFYFSTFPFQLFTHNIDKNSMFLLCNGLLVFVGITRSFSGPSGDDENNSKCVQHDVPSKYVEDDVPSKYVVEVDSQSQFLDAEANDENNIVAEEAIEIKYCAEEKVEKMIFVDEEEQEKESGQLILEVKETDEEKDVLDIGDAIDEEDKESEIDYFMIEENIEEEEEENCISTEELNKKFDDFIRRMKEDLRIEAKQQLFVMV